MMRESPGIFGYMGMDYPLKEITIEACEKAVEASLEFDSLQLLYEKTKDSSISHQIFEVRNQMVRNGTITLVMGISFLDSAFYRYACYSRHPDDIDKLFRKNGFIKAWAEVLKETKSIELKEANPLRGRLYRIIEARNAIIHQKAKWITKETVKWDQDEDEWENFRSAIVDFKPTFDACISLLRSERAAKGTSPIYQGSKRHQSNLPCIWAPGRGHSRWARKNRSHFAFKVPFPRSAS